MKVLDLFSGIGGFSLGLERAGMETVAFCEIDPFCNEVLDANFHGKNFGDVRGLSVSRLISCRKASRVEGATESFGFQPSWVVIENVQHTWRRWVPELRRSLWSVGYSSLPVQLSSAEVGACHLRRRVFIVANPDSEQLRKFERWWRRESGEVAKELARERDSTPRGLGADDGLPDWAHRRKALGNAVDPYCVEVIGRGIIACDPTTT